MNLTTWRNPPKAVRKNVDRTTDIAPIGTLQEEVNRLFDQFFQSWPLTEATPRYGMESVTFYPKMDVREDDKHITIHADLPGMTEKDVDVLVSPGSITIRGERKEESSRKDSGYYVCERSFGHFERTFTLPNGLDMDKIHASFKNGALTVDMPKTAEARKAVRKLDLTGHN